ncbi:MAG: hypothetical protein R3258_00325 [Acidimicrobiia bacterium]|nr:hypothetical protein [Acidimicrobiia bacterium]
MRNKIIASLAAGAILVGAGFATALISSPSAAIAQETDEVSHAGRGLAFLSGVLADLVSEGEINQEDADTVLAAVEEAIAEAKAEREALRAAIEEAFEDGEMTLEEAEILPEGNWLLSERFEEAWEDGVLTLEEVRAERQHPRRNAFRHGARFGMLMDDGGIDQDEYDAIPDEHPLKQMDIGDALDDGLITPPELRELFQQYKESMDS